ncbi:MAG: HDIG domain-containing protein [Clostridiales bacterium]|nr:HDIG domain-containing protein [Clostridiales bacterium]
MVYRFKQFIWAITSIFSSMDDSIVEKYLDNDEKVLFNRLNKMEKSHSIRVCNMALKNNKNNDVDKNKLAKIALLHDIGKSYKSLNVVDKSVLVILDKITSGRLKKFNKNNKVDIYYNHGKKSVELLQKMKKGYDSEFMEAIEMHHYVLNNNNIYLKIIKECDDNS